MLSLDLSLPSRRQFLRVGAFGAGLGLADWLRAGDAAAAGPGRPKSAIMVFLSGGPSHLDTYDPKPGAPAGIRGEYRPIATNVPGIDVCEHLPLQAKMFDKFALLRGVVAKEVVHTDLEVMTGLPSTAATATGRPSFGAVVSRARGMVGGVPAFVSLRGMTAGCEPGPLGVAHRPFTPNGPDAAALRRPSAVSSSRLAGRVRLLDALDAARREADAATAGMDGFRRQAVEMITSGSVRAALDVGREPAAVRERYAGAEPFLVARRLVEAGVGFVTLGIDGWDTHADHFPTLRGLLPTLDRGVAALVADLHGRGLAGDCVVVVWGEFGRTPRINDRGGRDHWTRAMSVLLAGGSLKTGQVIGATDARGEEPTSGKCSIPRVLAAVYRAIGIDPATTIRDASGRPVHLVDDREPIPGLL